MKTYVVYNQRTGEPEKMVPADVARGLYEALDTMEKMASDCDNGQYMDYPDARGVFENARAALAAADGEEV